MQSKQYLSKDGKVFGPFSEGDLKTMKEKGEYYQYEWYWDGISPDWTPVPKQGATPPPLPISSAAPDTLTKIEVTRSSIKAPVKKPPTEKTSSKTFCAIAFDQRHSLGGEVMHASATGGTFFSTPHSTTAFPKGSTIWLDLLDEETDKSAKVRCTITGIKREGNQWILELDWDACPLIN